MYSKKKFFFKKYVLKQNKLVLRKGSDLILLGDLPKISVAESSQFPIEFLNFEFIFKNNFIFENINVYIYFDFVIFILIEFYKIIQLILIFNLIVEINLKFF